MRVLGVLGIVGPLLPYGDGSVVISACERLGGHFTASYTWSEDTEHIDIPTRGRALQIRILRGLLVQTCVTKEQIGTSNRDDVEWGLLVSCVPWGISVMKEMFQDERTQARRQVPPLSQHSVSWFHLPSPLGLILTLAMPLWLHPSSFRVNWTLWRRWSLGLGDY